MGERTDETNERVVQNIQAPVYGHVAGGNLTIVEMPPKQRELTWWDFSTEELRHYLREAYAAHRKAWLRYWFNKPVVFLVLYSLSLLALALKMITGSFAPHTLLPNSVLWPMWFVVINGVVMLPLGYWLQKVRRVEAHVAADAQADINAIELVLRRREYASR